MDHLVAGWCHVEDGGVEIPMAFRPKEDQIGCYAMPARCISVEGAQIVEYELLAPRDGPANDCQRCGVNPLRRAFGKLKLDGGMLPRWGIPTIGWKQCRHTFEQFPNVGILREGCSSWKAGFQKS